jgi:hypothetical protein
MPHQDSKTPPSPLDAFLKQQQEDCDRPACKDTADAISSALNRLKKANIPTKEVVNRTTISNPTSSSSSSSPTKECPPSKGVIGDSTWTFLHSMVRKDYLSVDAL